MEYRHIKDLFKNRQPLTCTTCGSYTHIEPSQATSGNAKQTLVLATGELLKTKDTPEPVDRLELTEELLLLMQVRTNVVAHQGEEGSNSKCFVAVAEHFIIDRMPVMKI